MSTMTYDYTYVHKEKENYVIRLQCFICPPLQFSNSIFFTFVRMGHLK